MAYRKKYKAHILKYKALILKYVPCILKYVPYIFCLYKLLKNNVLFRPKNSASQTPFLPANVNKKGLL